MHVHDWFGTLGGSLIAGTPSPAVRHDRPLDRIRPLPGHPWEHILGREQLGIRAATRVIAVSRHLRQQLIDRYNADPKRVRVIYNAVRPTERLERIDPTKRIVLYVGRLAAMKGVDTFLRAAAKVNPVVPGRPVRDRGRGSGVPSSRGARGPARDRGPGDVPRQGHRRGARDPPGGRVRLRSPERSSNRSVSPRSKRWPRACPTIVSKTSGVAEISSGTFRVDFWDVDEFASRIAELLEYPTLRRTMGEEGRWEALREGWPERARETVAVYLDAMRAAGVRP